MSTWKKKASAVIKINKQIVGRLISSVKSCISGHLYIYNCFIDRIWRDIHCNIVSGNIFVP